MDFGLTPDQKRTVLLSTKEGQMNELYTLLIRVGIDPDTFDGLPEAPDGDMSIYGERLRISRLLDSIALIDAKLAEIGV